MEEMTQEIAPPSLFMKLFAPVDQYCERTAPGFWGEPLNLLTNLSFILAGLFILGSAPHQVALKPRKGSLLLPSLMIAIGVGSALFHSFANLWSMWADVVPIGLFILAYLWLFLRHEALLTVVSSLMCFLGFFALSLACSELASTSTANGSEHYFGTWIVLFGITCFYWGRRQWLQVLATSAATLIFALSLIFRTIDLRHCDLWPYGTHLLWHVLNGIVLFLVTKAYLTSTGPVLNSHP